MITVIKRAEFALGNRDNMGFPCVFAAVALRSGWSSFAE
jgi:hypothetical protein